MFESGNWDFSSLKNKSKNKMLNKWRTIKSLVYTKFDLSCVTFSCVTPAGKSNELDVQNKWEEKHNTTDASPAIASCLLNRQKREEEKKEVSQRTSSPPTLAVWLDSLGGTPITVNGINACCA